jgi:hypothetical protein
VRARGSRGGRSGSGGCRRRPAERPRRARPSSCATGCRNARRRENRRSSVAQRSGASRARNSHRPWSASFLTGSFGSPLRPSNIPVTRKSPARGRPCDSCPRGPPRRPPAAGRRRRGRPGQAIYLGRERGVGDALVFEENGGAVAAPLGDVAVEELFSGVQALRVGPELRQRVDALRPRSAGRKVLRWNTAQLVAAGGIVPGVAGTRDLA